MWYIENQRQARRTEPYKLKFTEHLSRFLIDPNQFLFEVSYNVSQYLMTLDLIAVRQEVNNLEISVVVRKELVFTMINLALYGLL